MKKIIMYGIIILSLALTLFLFSKAYAAATSETGDTSAIPCTLYGKTSEGVLTAFQVDANGVIQITS